MKLSNFIEYLSSCFDIGTDYRILYFELLGKYQDLQNELDNRPTLLQFLVTTFISFIGGFCICFIILKGKI